MFSYTEYTKTENTTLGDAYWLRVFTAQALTGVVMKTDPDDTAWCAVRTAQEALRLLKESEGQK